MEKLFDETFVDESLNVASRNIWFGYIDLYVDGQYGKSIDLTEEIANTIVKKVHETFNEDVKIKPTEINWYFYGSEKTTDAIEDSVRPSMMIRYKDNEFLVHMNISDHDFALNLDDIMLYQDKIKSMLKLNS